VSGDPAGLWILVRNPDDGREIEIQAHLDSGAEKPLFDGQYARAIGRKPRSIQPMGPKKKSFLCGSTANRIRSSSPE
jgi:hypothetical protein